MYANARSRRGQEWFSQAEDCLRNAGLPISEALLTRDPKKLDQKVEQAIRKGTELVIVGGGDGTLSMVARHFANNQSTLGLLPLGTGNSLARDLTIVASVPEACKTILEGDTRPVDLGYIGDDYFVNVATVGLTTRIVMHLDDQAKKRFGRAAYLFALIDGLLRVQAFHAKITTPQESMEFETLQIVIGNGRYHAGPFPLAPDAAITEGKLSIYALATTNRAAFFRLAWALRTGRHVDLPEVHSASASEGRLETKPSRKVVVDGEIAEATPVDFKVAPGALKVRVPQGFQG